jgi:Family of unknown function (DUF5677)
VIADIETIEEAVQYASEAEQIAIEAIAALSLKKNVASAVSSIFIARALQALLSATLLSQKGLIADAWSSSRTAIELDIEHAYIFAEDFEKRWAMYQDFSAITKSKILRSIKDIGGNVDPVHEEDLLQIERSVKAALGKDTSQWAGGGINLLKRAEATGRKYFYELGYREGCQATHGGCASLEYVLPQLTETLPIEILVGPGQPRSRPIVLCVITFLQLVATALNQHSIESLDERFNALTDKIQSKSPHEITEAGNTER